MITERNETALKPSPNSGQPGFDTTPKAPDLDHQPGPHSSLDLAIQSDRICLLDPSIIIQAQCFNRLPDVYDSDEFDALKCSVLAAGGNQQPILIRTLAEPHANATYEVVYGHRRLRACKELSLRVRAIVATDLTDGDAALARLRENEARSNLSPFEFGLQIRHAMDVTPGLSQRQLALALGRDVSDVNRALQLALLPDAVLTAFASPRDLQFRHAKPLSDAMKERLPEVLAAASTIASAGKKLSPNEVLDKLVGTDKSGGVGRSNTQGEQAIKLDGQAIGHIKIGKAGRCVVEIDEPLDQRDQDALMRSIVVFARKRRDKAAAKVLKSKVNATGASA